MDGTTFVEKFTEIIEKISQITEKSYSDWTVISDDPGCDADYGVDKEGRLIIDGKGTNLKLSELQEIRYRAKDGWIDEDRGYISLRFVGDRVFYLYFDSFSDLGDEKYGLECKERYFDAYTVKRVIHEKDYVWGEPLVVSEDHELIAYMGGEKEVEIPDGITTIGPCAFPMERGIKSVILPESVKKIGDYAFFSCWLEQIEMRGVEVIEEGAFFNTGIRHAVIPATVRHIGEKAFYYTGMESADCIENHSNVVIDDKIFKKSSQKEKISEQ